MIGNADKKITILFINLYTEMGGGEYVIYYLLKELNRSRYEPIMMFNQRGTFVDKVEALGVRTIIIPFHVVMLKELIRPATISDAMQTSRKISKYLRENPTDIIHCSDVLSLVFIAMPVLRFRIPVLYVVLFFYEWTRMIAFNFLALLTVRTIVTHSLAMKKDLVKRTLFLKGRTETIHPGVDSSVYVSLKVGEKNTLRDELSIHESTKLVGMVARYELAKGHDLFLKAASMVVKKRDDVNFLVIGGDRNTDGVPAFRKYKDEVMKLHQELNLGNRILFIPQRDDMPMVLRGLDLLVCPSLKEGFGLVVLEALSSGVPVVVSGVAGVLEVVSDFPGATVASADSVSSLSECIVKALSEVDGGTERISNKRSQIASGVRQKNLSWQLHVRKIENMYNTLIRSNE